MFKKKYILTYYDNTIIAHYRWKWRARRKIKKLGLIYAKIKRIRKET